MKISSCALLFRVCVALLSFSQSVNAIGSGSRGGRLCQEVKTSLEQERNGIRLSGFPTSYSNEVELEFCPKGPTCCNKEIEKVLGDWSKTEFVLHMQRHTQKIASPLKIYASKLEKFVEELMNRSQKEENEFFLKTYGIFYMEKQDMFKRFWDEIRDYYVRGRTNLVDVTYNFFSELYQKIFQTMNAQYVMDDQYMNCVAETMNEVVPFGDTPKGLAMALRHSMVAVRALSKSLKDALEVAIQLGDVSEPSSSCYKALQSMHTCPVCMGMLNVKPCPKYCSSVMQSCLSRHLNLQELWDEFINSTVSLLDRISGRFNIESVLKRKDIVISTAIMDFQTKQRFANEKVFHICGIPQRVKRSTEEFPINSFVFDRPSDLSLPQALYDQDSRLYRIVAEVRRVLTSTKGFWRSLPAKLCEEQSEEAFANAAPSECWNGESLQNANSAASPSENSFSSPGLLGSSAPSKREAGEGNTFVEGEEEVPIPSVFHEKKFRLQSVLNQVNLATEGQDVEWFDQESDFDERFQVNIGPGSGDFDGSGDLFNNIIFSGDGHDLDESYSGEKESDEDEDQWNDWNPFSTSTPRSTVEMDVDVQEESSSSRISSISATFLVLHQFLNIAIFL